MDAASQLSVKRGCWTKADVVADKSNYVSIDGIAYEGSAGDDALLLNAMKAA